LYPVNKQAIKEMRKLKLQAQISLDGFHSGPSGELDWMTWKWDEKLISYVKDITEPVDTILLGRKMTDGFVNYWENIYQQPSHPEYEGAKKFVETPKIAFTKTMTTSPWKNTTLATGDLVEEVQALRDMDGSDIIVYGGTEFVSNLIKEGLIDELNLFINPTAIGKGNSIFAGLHENQGFSLKRSIGFDCGVVALQYERKEN
jgi:dihydrofolate reductase